MTTTDPFARFTFVLVEPQFAGNVGSTARALKNLGFSRLTLVGPGCSTSDEEARRFAVDAADVLAVASVYAGLDEALARAGAVVGTSRRMGKHRQPHLRIDELAPKLAWLARDARTTEVAVVFGREAHGLNDRELDRCTHLAYIPTASVYPSMNLAHAVAVTAYEISRAIHALDPLPEPRPAGAPDDAGDEAEPLADHETREAMYAHLEEALFAAGFLHDEQAEGMMRRLRRILGRAELTRGDAAIVRGIARQILWLARQR